MTNNRLTASMIRCLVLMAVGFVVFGHEQTQAQSLIETLDPYPVPFIPKDSRIGHYSNVKSALGDLPGVVLWHFRLFYIGPQNLQKLERALDREWERLGAGETKTVWVVARRVGGDANVAPTIVFQYVMEAGSASLLQKNDFIAGAYDISKPRKLIVRPLLYFSSDRFRRCTEAGLCADSLSLEDHKFVVDHWNGSHGTENGPAEIDLLDRSARSGVEGTVILRADQVSGQYRVFNTSNGTTETYPKGASMRDRHNTVWILAKADGREYTIVHNRLKSVGQGIAPGVQVVVRQSVGEYSEEQDAGLEIWRVNGPSQYFLKNGAYRVAPVQ